MFTKQIKYTDLDGNEKVREAQFHFSKAELLEKEMSMYGGFEATVNKIMETKDSKALIELFKELILKAYGEKAPDGTRFIKSEEMSREFSQTEAYSEYFIQLATDDDAAAEFVNGVMPASMKGQVSKALEDMKKNKDATSKVVDMPTEVK